MKVETMKKLTRLILSVLVLGSSSYADDVGWSDIQSPDGLGNGNKVFNVDHSTANSTGSNVTPSIVLKGGFFEIHGRLATQGSGAVETKYVSATVQSNSRISTGTVQTTATGGHPTLVPYVTSLTQYNLTCASGKASPDTRYAVVETGVNMQSACRTGTAVMPTPSCTGSPSAFALPIGQTLKVCATNSDGTNIPRYIDVTTKEQTERDDALDHD